MWKNDVSTNKNDCFNGNLTVRKNESFDGASRVREKVLLTLRKKIF